MFQVCKSAIFHILQKDAGRHTFLLSSLLKNSLFSVQCWGCTMLIAYWSESTEKSAAFSSYYFACQFYKRPPNTLVAQVQHWSVFSGDAECPLRAAFRSLIYSRRSSNISVVAGGCLLKWCLLHPKCWWSCRAQQGWGEYPDYGTTAHFPGMILQDHSRDSLAGCQEIHRWQVYVTVYALETNMSH